MELEQEVLAMRRESVNIHRAFAEMLPLIKGLHLLSFNAKLASFRLGAQGSSFSVVVTDIRHMVSELQSLIVEVEHVFWDMVNRVARWEKAECELNLLQRSIDQVRKRKNPDAQEFSWEQALLPRTAQRWEEERNILKDRDVEYRLWQEILQRRESMVENVKELNRVSGRLSGMTERIGAVSVRKSSYLAITAMIESARVKDETSNLNTVAESLRELANKIAVAEEKAQIQMARLLSLSVEFAKLTRNGGV